MTNIYKYEVRLGVTKLTMPLGADLLCVQMQPSQGLFFLWARIDTSEPLVEYIIRSYATGEEIPDDLDEQLVHISTTLTGQYVWHFFEDITPC